MKFYNNSSIKAKLKFVILSTCILTIILVFTGFFIYEHVTYREILINDLSTKADIIAENINAALTFRDSIDAASVLNSLNSQPHLNAAAIYDEKGNIFATYNPLNQKKKFPQYPAKNNLYQFNDDEIIGYKPITLDETRIGTLYLSMDLTGQEERFWSYIEIAFIVLIGTLIVAYTVATIFAKNISAPIVKLSKAAQLISTHEDYTIRAEKETNDETGFLVDSFNQMLTQIMDRDKNLRRANKTLQSAENRYRTTLDSMLEGCQIIGYDWRYLYLNDVAVAHSRTNKEKLIGSKMMDIYPGFEDTEVFTHFRRCMEKRIPFNTENEFAYPDGMKRWFKLNIEPVPEGIFILSVDITEERLLKEELKKHHEHLEELVHHRTKQLEEVNKELESFSYTVSHDLRAPIRHIDSFLDIVQKNIGGTLDEKNLRYFNLIKESAKEMGILIDDLLTFSRTTKTEINKTKIKLSRIVSEVIEKIEIDNKNNSIEWNVSELPEISGDQSLLRIALVNLISNAVKFSEKNDKIIITIGSHLLDDKAIIHIKDNGVGFDMKYYDKLFGVFQRLHSIADYAGTGIGLATVKKIITKHGGEVWAQSKEGDGATFYISLPI